MTFFTNLNSIFIKTSKVSMRKTARTRTQHSEKRPRDQETKRPRDQETKRPRDKETKRPRDKETKRPRDKETKRQRDKETMQWSFQVSHRDTLTLNQDKDERRVKDLLLGSKVKDKRRPQLWRSRPITKQETKWKEPFLCFSCKSSDEDFLCRMRTDSERDVMWRALRGWIVS